MKMRQSAFACGKVRQSLGGNDQVWDSLCILCTSWNVSVASAKTSQGLSTSGLQPGSFTCDAHIQADTVVQQPKGVYCMCLVQGSATVNNILGIMCLLIVTNRSNFICSEDCAGSSFKKDRMKLQ